MKLRYFIKSKIPRFAEWARITGIYNKASQQRKRHKEYRDQLDDGLDASHHASEQHAEGVRKHSVPQDHLGEQQQHRPRSVHVQEVVVLVNRAYDVDLYEYGRH